MRSNKPIWDFRVGMKTYKKFKVPREMAKVISSASRKERQRVNNKRARTLNYMDVLGFE